MNGLDRFPALALPSSDFAAARDARRTPPLKYDVDLTTARSIAAGTALFVAGIVGNSLYIDQSTDSGIGTLYLSDRNEAGVASITVSGGYGFFGPFVGIVLENTAQPGKFLRIRYGTDIDFRPNVFSITGTVNTREQGFAYGASYASNSVIAAGGTSQVFAPASNVNGAVVHSVSAYSVSVGAQGIALLAKTGAAPTTIIDGDGIVSVVTGTAGSFVNLPQLTGPVLIPAGKGLWFYANALETGAARHLLYTLL